LAAYEWGEDMAVTSVNGKEGVVTLKAADVEAVATSPAINSKGLVIGETAAEAGEACLKVEGTYADSGSEGFNPISASVTNTGTKPMVAVYASGKGAHVWGANLIGQTEGENQTAIAVEVDFGHLTKNATEHPETGSVAYGIDIVYLPHKFPTINSGAFIQIIATHNAGGSNLGCAHGIQFQGSTETQPIASTGSAINFHDIECAVGINMEEGTVFTEAGIKLGKNKLLGEESIGEEPLEKECVTQPKVAKSVLENIGATGLQQAIYATPRNLPPNTLVVATNEQLYLLRFVVPNVMKVKSTAFNVQAASTDATDTIDLAIWSYIASTWKELWHATPQESMTNIAGVGMIEGEYTLEPGIVYYAGILCKFSATGPSLGAQSWGTKAVELTAHGLTNKKTANATLSAPSAEMAAIAAQATMPGSPGSFTGTNSAPVLCLREYT
jgi:hypothetical protein